MTYMNVIEEFQARRRKVLKIAGPWVLIGVIGSLVAVFYAKDPSAPLSQTGMILVAGAFLSCIIVGASIVLRYYRCPACGNVPKARYGILFGLSKCPTCGARLK
jgi:membrane protein YdbS with pleckstrin-like domain